MRIIVLLALGLLVGCDSETIGEKVSRACRFEEDVPSWDRCVEQETRFLERNVRPDDDNAAALLMIGTGILNGYNQGRVTQPPPVMTTCSRAGGGIINCMSQ